MVAVRIHFTEELRNNCSSQRVRVRTTKVYGESTVSRILQLVEHASANKSRPEQFITRFARVYTPVVVLLAALLALVPPLFTGFNFALWVERALTFLVISCPCALVISVPLTFFSGIGGASRKGILVKGAVYMEKLERMSVAVFDKTGTLTCGELWLQRSKEPAAIPLPARSVPHVMKAVSLLRRTCGKSPDAVYPGWWMARSLRLAMIK